MSNAELLLKEIEGLPPAAVARVIDFASHLKHQAPSAGKSPEAEEPLPRVSRAERAERRKNNPLMQFLDQPFEYDWSWLPEGLTPETLTKKDIRDLRLKAKYGI
jgi:hypothetical protein